jgi:hypothetical protein
MDGAYPIVNRTWAAVLVDTTAIGKGGFPLAPRSAAFFALQP